MHQTFTPFLKHLSAHEKHFVQKYFYYNNFLPAATKLGQGNKFTRVCLSTRGGGACSKFSGVGGACSKFSGGGCLLQIFGGVPAPNSGGCLLQIFGGPAPNFRGGSCSKFSGGMFWNFFFFQFIYPPKKILLACTSPPHPPPPPETVNARPVRILLECILVLKKFRVLLW